MMFHCHEKGIENDAYGNGKVHEWVRDHNLCKALDAKPLWTAFPDENFQCEGFPVRRAFWL